MPCDKKRVNQNHHYLHLIDIFSQCFEHQYHTRLVKGEHEPLYLPASPEVPWHQIIFAHGFYASALHEIAHWCIAGEARRQQVDFGYWYCPDGRDTHMQRQFEKSEIKPQAIEWMFSVAAGFPFRVSCDNLDGSAEPDHIAFQQQVHHQVLRYLQQGPPLRAAQFIEALQLFYHTPALTAEAFSLPQQADCD